MRFVLVHGGFHGAWCWAKLTPELEALGHEVVAIDLPGAGERMHERATLASWRGALREVIEDGDVLVGHSQGGFGISLRGRRGARQDRPSRLPLRRGADPGQVADRSRTAGQRLAGDHRDGGRGVPGDHRAARAGACVAFTNPEAANKVFYHDCTPEDQAWAFERLTPLVVGPTLEVFDIPRFWEAPIPRDFIMCSDDFSHPVSSDNEFMRRLGLSTCFSIRSSHSPFVSRPAETAQLLDLCARGTLS